MISKADQSLVVVLLVPVSSLEAVALSRQEVPLLSSLDS